MEEHQAKAKKRPDSRSAGAEEHYCPICGREAADHNLRRFGEYFCSEAHVAEYAQEIRARVGKKQAAARPEASVVFGSPAIVPLVGRRLWSPRFHYCYLLRAEC